jgi:hypothetical protein
MQTGAGRPSAAALLGSSGLCGPARRALGATSAVPIEGEGKGRPPEPDAIDGADDDRPRRRTGVDLLDPMARTLYCHSGALGLERAMPAALSSTGSPSAAPPDTVATASRVSLEHVMSRFVRRVAWSGDAHTGTARIELGAGALSGATLTIHSEYGTVHVSLELPPGVDRTEWRDRIARRLWARGLQVAALEVE